MLRPEDTLPNFHALLLQCLCPGIESEFFVHVSHDMHHLCLSFRVLRQPCLDVVRGFVQDLPGGNAIAGLFAGVRHRKHSSHEVRDASRAITLEPGALQLYALRYGKGREHRYQPHGDSYPKPMPSNVLPRAISSTGRMSRHGLIAQVSAQVCGKLSRRTIAPFTVLLKRLEHNRIRIAAKFTAQPRTIAAP